MSAAHTATHNSDGSFLSSAFTVAAGGAVAAAAGIVSAPTAVGVVAALAGFGLLNRALSSSEGTGNVAMVAAVTAAVTTFVTGLPMEFLSEALVFPWAHDTAFGAQTMQATGDILVPFYDTIGSWFGIEPYGQAAANIPVADI